MTFPIARTEMISVRELPNETLIFDLECQKAHCLNQMVALIWRQCDGKRSVAVLAKIVEQQMSIANAQPLVELALEQLGNRKLLIEAPPPLTREVRVSRREALKQLAAAAIAIPLVMTITAKAVAATPTGFGGACDEDFDCIISICYSCIGTISTHTPAMCIGGLCSCPPGTSITEPNCAGNAPPPVANQPCNRAGSPCNGTCTPCQCINGVCV